MHFCLYLFEVCVFDLEYNALNSMQTYEVFPQSFIEHLWGDSRPWSVPSPVLGEISVWDRRVANPPRPLKWFSILFVRVLWVLFIIISCTWHFWQHPRVFVLGLRSLQLHPRISVTLHSHRENKYLRTRNLFISNWEFILHLKKYRFYENKIKHEFENITRRDGRRLFSCFSSSWISHF